MFSNFPLAAFMSTFLKHAWIQGNKTELLKQYSLAVHLQLRMLISSLVSCNFLEHHVFFAFVPSHAYSSIITFSIFKQKNVGDVDGRGRPWFVNVEGWSDGGSNIG